jgi:aminopeptidase N
VHELAHQWFGNCVSPDLWRDMWLNEGFASYAEWLWDEHEGGREAYERSARRAYGRLRNGKTGSPFDPGVERVFSGRVYTRGAMVLHGLRGEVGDEAFFRILKGWVEHRFDGNGSTQDFVQHAARTAGRDLGAFFAAWLFSEVTPEIPAWEPVEPEEPRRGRRGGGEPGGG